MDAPSAVKRGQQVDGVLIFRDADNQPRRRCGIDAARTWMQDKGGPGFWPDHIAVGVAIPKNEAWVLAGFEPVTDDERERLRSLTDKLGFAPNRQPERLSATGDPQSSREAKAALAFLGCDAQRKRACWCDTDLEVLRTRGRKCGLSDFLDEVREHLAPLFQ